MAVRLQDRPPIVRRAALALLISLLLLGLAWRGVLQRSSELYTIIAAVLAFLLARSAYSGFWLGLERAGVRDARARWQQQPPILQRAVQPPVIAGLVILIAWIGGIPPDSALIALLVITYALYLLPSRVRRFAVPLTALALAAAYPYFIQQTDYQR